MCEYPSTILSARVNRRKSFEVNLPAPVYEVPFDTVFDASYTYTDLSGYLYLPDDLISPVLIPPNEVYMSKDKLDLSEAQFKSYLSSFVHNGTTPFITPHYHHELPPILQDAYLVCSAYLSRTAANENMVFSILSSKVQQLHSTLQSCSIQDELAFLQAMVLYQIVRLFDDNIRQRSIAEAQFPLLDLWAARLRSRNELGFPSSIESLPYRNWLFKESIRRTTFMCLFLQGVYHAIKQGFCDKVPDMAGLPVTVRGDLWEMETENEWLLATQGYEPVVMSYHDFTGVWNGCTADGEVEGFQKILLVACIGEDGLKSRLLDPLAMGMV